MVIACKECKRAWTAGTYSAKTFGNRCPHCGNKYLVMACVLEETDGNDTV
jgi:DNA-directed RNA polymerase subunit RPC12/RpoP